MPKNYLLKLKGWVGGWSFDPIVVDCVLSGNPDKANVLIDSPGGDLNAGLSIRAAMMEHGNVHVHFVGANASAATVAAMGAKHISMDSGACMLIHRCSCFVDNYERRAALAAHRAAAERAGKPACFRFGTPRHLCPALQETVRQAQRTVPVRTLDYS